MRKGWLHELAITEGDGEGPVNTSGGEDVCSSNVVARSGSEEIQPRPHINDTEDKIEPQNSAVGEKNESDGAAPASSAEYEIDWIYPDTSKEEKKKPVAGEEPPVANEVLSITNGLKTLPSLRRKGSFGGDRDTRIITSKLIKSGSEPDLAVKYTDRRRPQKRYVRRRDWEADDEDEYVYRPERVGYAHPYPIPTTVGSSNKKSRNSGARVLPAQVSSDGIITFPKSDQAGNPSSSGVLPNLIVRRKTPAITNIESRDREYSEMKYVAWNRKELAVVEFSDEGYTRAKLISRSDIQQEARKMLPDAAPTIRVLGAWLSSRKHISPELREWADKLGFDARAPAFKRYLKEYLENSLQPRDLRTLDPGFSPKSALWVRHSAILLSLDKVRAIVMRKKMILFDPFRDDGPTAVKTVLKFVKAKPTVINALAAFEFRALEGIFTHVVARLEIDFRETLPPFENLLKKLGTTRQSLASAHTPQIQRHLNFLNRYLKRIEAVRTAMDTLLERDEDMSNMYLTDKHRRPYRVRSTMDHDEVEVLLETYVQQIAHFQNRAKALQENAEHAMNSITLQLDTARNKLLEMDMILAILSAGISMAGLISGTLGMNLPAPIFNSDASMWYFWVAVAVISLCVIGAILFALHFVKKYNRFTNKFKNFNFLKRRREKNAEKRKQALVALRNSRRR